MFVSRAYFVELSTSCDLHCAQNAHDAVDCDSPFCHYSYILLLLYLVVVLLLSLLLVMTAPYIYGPFACSVICGPLCTAPLHVALSVAPYVRPLCMWRYL